MANIKLNNGTSEVTDISDFEYQGLDYLYNLEALTKSTFYMAEFALKTKNDKGVETEIIKLPNAKYRLKGVAVNGMKLQWNDVNSFKPYPNAKGIAMGTTCTFSWVEDNLRTVEAFHKLWFNYWYSRQKNHFKSGTEGKFISTTVYVYHYAWVDNQIQAQIAYMIEFEGLAPTDLLEAKVDVDDDGNQTATYVYKYLEAKQTFDPSGVNQSNQNLNDEDQEFWTKLTTLNKKSFYL